MYLPVLASISRGHCSSWQRKAPSFFTYSAKTIVHHQCTCVHHQCTCLHHQCTCVHPDNICNLIRIQRSDLHKQRQYKLRFIDIVVLVMCTSSNIAFLNDTYFCVIRKEKYYICRILLVRQAAIGPRSKYLATKSVRNS